MIRLWKIPVAKFTVHKAVSHGRWKSHDGSQHTTKKRKKWQQRKEKQVKAEKRKIGMMAPPFRLMHISTENSIRT